MSDEFEKVVLGISDVDVDIGRGALLSSIKHWERLRKCRSLEEVFKEGIYVESCNLCNLYYDPPDKFDRCTKCPVFQASRSRFCIGTPYGKVSTFIEDLDEKRPRSRKFGKKKKRKWKRLCKDQILFLKSLVEAK